MRYCYLSLWYNFIPALPASATGAAGGFAVGDGHGNRLLLDLLLFLVQDKEEDDAHSQTPGGAFGGQNRTHNAADTALDIKMCIRDSFEGFGHEEIQDFDDLILDFFGREDALL